MERLPRPLGRLLAGLLLAGPVLTLGACGGDVAPATAEAAPTPRGPTGIHLRPVPGVPTIPAGPADAQARVACSTCHSMMTPDATRRSDEAATFHKGLHVAHGNLTCLSCHNDKDYDTLRLADGRRVAFEDVTQLCAQCHGPQARDYAHGAHGGMSGYWNPELGVQTRNQCTHCHAPHDPAYPSMRPTFKPRDRFLPHHSGADR